MNFTRSLLLGVFAASELGRAIRIKQETSGDCGAASDFYEQCELTIRAGTLETGLSAANESLVEYYFSLDNMGAADWHAMKADLEAELMYQIKNGYIDFPLITAEDIAGCGEFAIPAGCEDQVAKKQGMTEHARAEEADMTNFNAFLLSEHWVNDYRDNSTTPDGHPGDEGENGSEETQETTVV